MVLFGKRQTKRCKRRIHYKGEGINLNRCVGYTYPRNKKEPSALSLFPCLVDRSMQALHLLALEPVMETEADKNAYGFRPKRSCADAIAQCFTVLARKTSAPWILEGDIRACFDKLSGKWLEDNILTDKIILSKWLTAGYMEETDLASNLQRRASRWGHQSRNSCPSLKRL